MPSIRPFLVFFIFIFVAVALPRTHGIRSESESPSISESANSVTDASSGSEETLEVDAAYSFAGRKCKLLGEGYDINFRNETLCAHAPASFRNPYQLPGAKPSLELKCPFNDMVISDIRFAKWSVYPTLSPSTCDKHSGAARSSCTVPSSVMLNAIKPVCLGENHCKVPNTYAYWSRKYANLTHHRAICDFDNSGFEIYEVLSVEYACRKMVAASECYIYDTFCDNALTGTGTGGELQIGVPWSEYYYSDPLTVSVDTDKCNGLFGPDSHCIEFAPEAYPLVFAGICTGDIANPFVQLTLTSDRGVTANVQAELYIMGVYTVFNYTLRDSYEGEYSVKTILQRDWVPFLPNDCYFITISVELLEGSAIGNVYIRDFMMGSTDTPPHLCAYNAPSESQSADALPTPPASFSPSAEGGTRAEESPTESPPVAPPMMDMFDANYTFDHDSCTRLGDGYDVDYDNKTFCVVSPLNIGNPYSSADYSTAELICPFDDMVISRVVFARWAKYLFDFPRTCSRNAGNPISYCTVPTAAMLGILTSTCVGQNRCTIPTTWAFWNDYYSMLGRCAHTIPLVSGIYASFTYQCVKASPTNCYLYDTFCQAFASPVTGGLLMWNGPWEIAAGLAGSDLLNGTRFRECNGLIQDDYMCLQFKGSNTAYTNSFCSGALHGATFFLTVTTNTADTAFMRVGLDGVQIAGFFVSGEYVDEYSVNTYQFSLGSHVIGEGLHTVELQVSAEPDQTVFVRDFRLSSSNLNDTCLGTCQSLSESSSQTPTLSRSPSMSQTYTRTQSPSVTRSQTFTATKTHSNSESTINNTHSKSHSKSHSRSPKNSVSPSKSESDSESVSPAESESDSESVSQSQSRTGSESESVSQSHSKSHSKSHLKTHTNSKSKSESHSHSYSHSNSNSISHSESHSHSHLKTHSKSKSDSHSRLKTHSKSKSHSESHAHTHSNSHSKTDSHAHTRSKTHSHIHSHSKSPAHSKSHSKTQSRAATQSNRAHSVSNSHSLPHRTHSQLRSSSPTRAKGISVNNFGGEFGQTFFAVFLLVFFTFGIFTITVWYYCSQSQSKSKNI